MTKLSCEYLHHYVYLAPNELRHCCKRFFYKGEMKGDVKILNVDKEEDLDIDKVIEKKQELYEKINNGETNPCTGCPYLHKKDWGEINKKNFEIKQISVESTSVCSMKCTYCSEMYFGGLKPNYDVDKALDNLHKYKSSKNEFEFAWGGGEPTLLLDFENIFEKHTIKYNPTKNIVYSNALKYSKKIEQFLQKDLALLITSIDAGTPGMFKKIRGVKGIHKVLSNLKKYYDNSFNNKQTNIIIKYIFTEENLLKEEIDSFVELIKSYELTNCSFQISSDFKNEKIDLEQTTSMLELLIKLKNIGAKLVYFDYHSAPRIRKQLSNFLNDSLKIENNIISNYLEKNKVKSKKDIVVWGAGDTGRLIKKDNFFIKNDFLNIKYFVDKKISNQNTFIGKYEIKNIASLKENEYSILIASSAYYEEIYFEILALGINPNRILDQIYS